MTAGRIFTSGDGHTALFTLVAGSSTAHTPAAGIKADLVKTGTAGWTLTSRTSAEVVTLDSDGRATKITDRNANATTPSWASAKPTQIVSTRGVAGARTANISYDSAGLLSGYSQTSTGTTRTASFAHDPYGNLTGFTDMAEKTSTFICTDGRVSMIASPAGGVTKISYDGTGRVTNVEKANTSAGSPGNSITRLVYPSTTDFDTLTATQGTGTSAGTTTNTFGANTGQSVTQSLFTYNGAGNALTSSDALAATAPLSYNTDGTAATSHHRRRPTDPTRHPRHTPQPQKRRPLGAIGLEAAAAAGYYCGELIR